MRVKEANSLIASFLENCPKRWKLPTIKVYSDWKQYIKSTSFKPNINEYIEDLQYTYKKRRGKRIGDIIDNTIKDLYFYSTKLWAKFGIVKEYISICPSDGYCGSMLLNKTSVCPCIHIPLSNITSRAHLLITLMHEMGHINETSKKPTTAIEAEVSESAFYLHNYLGKYLEAGAENWMKKRFWHIYYKLKDEWNI